MSRDWFITLTERYCKLGCPLPDPDTFDVDDLAALAEQRLTPGGGFLRRLRCLFNNSFQWKLKPVCPVPRLSFRAMASSTLFPLSIIREVVLLSCARALPHSPSTAVGRSI